MRKILGFLALVALATGSASAAANTITDDLVENLDCSTLTRENVLRFIPSYKVEAKFKKLGAFVQNFDADGIGQCWALTRAQRKLIYLTNVQKASPATTTADAIKELEAQKRKRDLVLDMVRGTIPDTSCLGRSSMDQPEHCQGSEGRERPAPIQMVSYSFDTEIEELISTLRMPLGDEVLRVSPHMNWFWRNDSVFKKEGLDPVPLISNIDYSNKVAVRFLEGDLKKAQRWLFYRFSNLKFIGSSRERPIEEDQATQNDIKRLFKLGRMPLLQLRFDRTTIHTVMVTAMSEGPNGSVDYKLYDSNSPDPHAGPLAPNDQILRFQNGRFTYHRFEAIRKYGNAPVGVFLSDEDDMDEIQNAVFKHYAARCGR